MLIKGTEVERLRITSAGEYKMNGHTSTNTMLGAAYGFQDPSTGTYIQE